MHNISVVIWNDMKTIIFLSKIQALWTVWKYHSLIIYFQGWLMATRNWLLFPASGMKLHGELDVWKICKIVNEIQGALLLKRYIIVVLLAFTFIFIFVGQTHIVKFVLYKLPVHGQHRQRFQRPIDSLLQAHLYVQCMSDKILSKTNLFRLRIMES